MSISLKKILFAGTALVAMNYATQAHAAICPSTNGGPGTVTVGAGNCIDIDVDPAVSTAISFISDEGDPTAYVYDGVDITGNIITDTDDLGYINFTGDSTVSGKVGAAGLALNEIVAGGEGNTDTFSGDVFAYDILLGGGTTNFDGDVTVSSDDTITFYSNGEANFAGNVDGDINFNNNNASVNFADGANITGNIYDGAEFPGDGTVNFAGSSNVDGSIGLDGSEISEIFFNGGAGKTVNISGEIHNLDFTTIVNGEGTVNIGGSFNEGNLQFNEDGVVNWDYTAGEGFWDGDIYSNGGTVGNGKGSLSITGENPYLDGSFGGGEGVLKEFFFGGDNEMFVNGFFIAADTTTLNGNQIDVVGNFFIGDGQLLNTAIIDDEGGIGNIQGDYYNNDNTSTVESGTMVDIVVDPSNTDYIDVGETYTIVNANNVASNSIGVADVLDTLLLDFEQTFPNDDDLVVEIVGRKRISEVFDGNIGDAIDDACDPAITEGGCSGEIKDLENALLSEDDQEAGEDRLEAAGGDQNGAGTQGALDIEGATAKVIEDRIIVARAGETGTGMAAGAAANSGGMWLQGYGQRAQQDFRDGIAGYDAYTVGGAIGADSADIMEGGILGLAFNYAVTNISSNNVNTTSTQVKNTGGTLYGTHEFGEGVFMKGQAGYSSNKIESTRHNVGGFPGLFAHSDYNSDQYAAKAILGRDFGMSDGFTLTPDAMASYTYLKTDGYTETGNAGLLLLKVRDDSFDSFKLGVDINAEWTFKNAGGAEMKPVLHAGYAYDVTGDNLDSTASFVGGGSTFTTTGADPARNIFKVGAGFTYVAAANWDLKADYDYTYKQDYDSHAGLIRATTHF